MSWEVVFDDAFESEFDELPQEVQDEIYAKLEVLENHGPDLDRPYVDRVKGSEHANMKELRCQVGGDPWRVLFAFDAHRRAILLVGGNKGRDEKRFYKKAINTADKRFRNYP